MDPITKIIEEAKEFKCCPHCGNTEITVNYCEQCERPFIKPAQALFFANYLKKKYERE